MKKANLLSRLFLWFSNTDYNLYKNCNASAKGKRITFSLFVLTTALVSGISCSYLIRTIFTDFNEATQTYDSNLGVWILSFFISLIWMCVVIAIDRSIISLNVKDKKEDGKMRQLITMASGRIVLAIAIGFIMSKPVEVQLFSKAINKSLTEASIEENQRHYNRYDKILDDVEAEIQDRKKAITSHKEKMIHWQAVMEAEIVGRVQAGRTGIAGAGPAWEAANSSFNLHKDLCQEEEQQLAELLKNKEKIKQEAGQDLKDAIVEQSFDFISQYKMLAEIKKTDKQIRSFGLAITLLFILIEVLPAVMRLFSDNDYYDHMEAVVENINKEYLTITANKYMNEYSLAAQNGNSINEKDFPLIILPEILNNVYR